MTELEAIRERVDAFDELQEMPMSLRFGTRHDLVLARDIIREYDRIATEQAKRIEELETLAVRDEELKAIFGWSAACVKDNGWVDVEYGVQLIRNGKKLAALGTSREDSDANH